MQRGQAILPGQSRDSSMSEGPPGAAQSQPIGFELVSGFLEGIPDR